MGVGREEWYGPIGPNAATVEFLTRCFERVFGNGELV